MIVHIVMIEPRADLERGALAAAIVDLQTAAREIPSIRQLRIGRRIRHGLPGYEQSMARDFSYAVIIEFDDQAGLEQYLRHPSHAALSRHFATVGEQSLAYDYEFVDAGELPAEMDLPAEAGSHGEST